MYHVDDEIDFSDRVGGLHSYLVYRGPEGKEQVLRGGQPTEKNQSGIPSFFRGLFGGHIEVQTGNLAESSDRYSSTYRPHRMVIPIKTNAYDAILWAAAKERVEEIGKQKYSYDVTKNAQLFSGAQNSNSVVAAALGKMGINPLDIVPDELIPHLPGIQNDLRHGPDESVPSGNTLETRRSGMPKPAPVNSDLLEHNKPLRQERKRLEREEQRRKEQLPAAPFDRKTDFAKDRRKEVRTLAEAVTAPPATSLEASALSDGARWNHSQLMGAMKSEAYWNARKPLSSAIRKGVSARFKALSSARGLLTGPGASRRRGGLPVESEFDLHPAGPKARGGIPLSDAQKNLAAALEPLAERKGVSATTRIAQTALNQLTFAPLSPMLDDLPEPLKVDGDFGRKTQERTRQVLNRIGTEPLQLQISNGLNEFEADLPL